jgi:hypothetical protein
MDPGTATIAAAGISTLGGALGNIFGGNKQQQKPYRDPNEDYLSLFGPILSAENTEMSAESRKAAVQDTGELAAAAMVGSANQSNQGQAITEAIGEQGTAAQLQAGVAGQYAQSNIGLETKSGEGKLAAELTPVQTAKDFAKSYGEGTIKLAGLGTQGIAEIGKGLTTETGAVGRTGIESQTALGGKQLEGATLLGQGAQTGTTQLGQQTLLSQGNLEGAALQGEQALLQPTATTLASAGQQTLAGQNELALKIASTNLDIAKGQENTRNQLALQRGQVEGQLAIKRYGAQMAAQGRASFA